MLYLATLKKDVSMISLVMQHLKVEQEEPAVALAAMVAFAGLAFRLSICPLAEKSISQRKPQRTKEALPVSRRLLFSLSQSSIQSNFKRLIPVLVVILFLVSAMGIAGVYSGQFQIRSPYEFAFSVGASGSYSSVQVYPFELSNWKNNLFPIRQSEELQNVPGVLHVQYQNYTGASMVIPVDALASRSLKRLCRTVQLSDTGIAPGSGVGNHRWALDRDSLGTPVFAVGVPTVVEASTLAADLLNREELPPLGEGRGLLVTPKDIDSQVNDLSKVIGYGISLALQPGLDVSDLDLLLS